MKQELTEAQKNCSHTKYEKYYEEHEDWDTGDVIRTECWREVSTEEDLDLHRTKCTKCGMIGYYSGAAKDWYEKGISSKGIKGLG